MDRLSGGGNCSASNVDFDNTSISLSSTNVQDAIVESDSKLDTQNGKLEAFYSDQYSLFGFTYRSASNDRHDIYFADDGNISFYHGSDVIWQTNPINIKNRVTFTCTDFNDRSSFYKIGRIVIATIQLVITSNITVSIFSLANDATIKPNNIIVASALVQNSSDGTSLGTASIFTGDLANFNVTPTGAVASNCAIVAQLMWVTQA